jgi:hypothetical protein
MKIYQEVHLDLGQVPVTDLIRIATAFCYASSDWEWFEEKTNSSPSTTEGPAFAVSYRKYAESINPVVHICRKAGSVFRISNVTPRDVSPVTISKEDYNMIAKRFGLDFRSYSRKESLGISVYIPKPDLGLNKIIESGVTRTALERFLAAYPLSGHQLDEDRLHEFTCTAFRRKLQFSLDYLERYLVEDRGWESDKAKDCREKIEVGLNVLRVYRQT